MVQSSGLKGCLRAAYRQANDVGDEDDAVTTLFGKAGGEGQNFAGAIAPGDARILLFPVRSLAGVFAWTTSLHALATFQRVARLAGQEIPWDVPAVPNENTALLRYPNDLQVGDDIVLEEFSFKAETKESEKVSTIAEWLAKNALLPEYDYWKTSLPKRLCILPENAFRDFCLYATEVQTHVNIDPAKKTVKTGALWTTENLPVDTLLYAPLMATSPRNGDDKRNGEQMLQELSRQNMTRLQIGGDETTGQGWVGTRFYPEVTK